MKREFYESLEAIIRETATILERSAIATSYNDRLMIEILGDETTLAASLLRSQIGDSGLNIVLKRLIHSIVDSPMRERGSARQCYATMCDELYEELQVGELTTIHALYYAAKDRRTALSYELRGYGISAEDILQFIEDGDNATEVTEGAAISAEGITTMAETPDEVEDSASAEGGSAKSDAKVVIFIGGLNALSHDSDVAI